MKRHPTTSTKGQNSDAGEIARTTHAGGNGAAASEVSERPHLRLVQTRLWSHTLILKGNLDGRAAAELEDEIECLRQEGVTALTLDLTQLEAIDPSGAQVIAFQSELFEGRGGQFAVQTSSPVIRRALCAAGAEVAAPAGAQLTVRRISRAPLETTRPDLATTMIREFGVA